MSVVNPFVPSITKLEIKSVEALPTKKPKDPDLAFEIEYEVTWNHHHGSHRFWRLDIGLFEIDLVDAGQTFFDILAGNSESWEEKYVSLTEKGYRIFGPNAATSVYMDNLPFDPAVEGRIRKFIADHSLTIHNSCTVVIDNLIKQTIPDSVVRTVLGDDWTWNSYEKDPDKWFAKWGVVMPSTDIVRSGSVTLTATAEAIKEAFDKGEIAIIDWSTGSIKKALDLDPIVKAHAVVQEVEVAPVHAWSK